jgi:hypothetical protein
MRKQTRQTRLCHMDVAFRRMIRDLGMTQSITCGVEKTLK